MNKKSETAYDSGLKMGNMIKDMLSIVNKDTKDLECRFLEGFRDGLKEEKKRKLQSKLKRLIRGIKKV